MMLSQRAEEFRNQTMLQNYNENFSDLSYNQLRMPPPSEYNLVHHVDQPWYNYNSGIQNGSTDLYGRSNDSKTPDWSYHSDTESPFITPQINNNSSESQYHSVPQVMGQQMQMDGSMMMPSQNQMMGSNDPLMINEVHNGLMNGVESAQIEPNRTVTKEDESLPKLEGPQATLISSESSAKEINRDNMKLPGFHQTFGNITEIGRFSQHDDYFESQPTEIIEQPKISESLDVMPKRKPRGRKRKQPEPREMFQRPNYSSPEIHGQCMQEPPQWQYQHHNQQYDQYQQWRSHPYYHQQHYHQHYPNPPPPHNMYYQHYNDCSPYHYNNPYQNSNWHMNRDYSMVHNYPGYV